jgi:malate dehydrogenase (oxaloacetate-decarboxylating)
LQLINPLKLLIKKRFGIIKVVISGAGSAGYGIFKILRAGCNDSLGAIYKGRRGLDNSPYKREISIKTNQRELQGTLAEVIREAEVFIDVFGKGIRI